MADCPSREEPQGLIGAPMTAHKKGRTGGDRATQKTANSQYHTETDRLIGWFNLAKPSRNRQPKRGWQRGKQRGGVDAFLVAHLALFAVLLALIVGGLTYA